MPFAQQYFITITAIPQMFAQGRNPCSHILLQFKRLSETSLFNTLPGKLWVIAEYAVKRVLRRVKLSKKDIIDSFTKTNAQKPRCATSSLGSF
jgi:hypothetical protein